jgi:hypothetical protein
MWLRGSGAALGRRPMGLASLLVPLVICLGLPGLTASAQQQSPLIIGNDRGGGVGERARLVDSLQASGQRIEIRGNLCYSACTMYLGAGNICVSPDTVFGFHGPTRNGQPLPTESFDHWSRIMARYYNEPLGNWFMSEARYLRSDVYRLTGSQLIELGYPSC